MPITITPITITPITITSTICNDDTSVGGIESPLLLGHQSRYWPEPCLVLDKDPDKIYDRLRALARVDFRKIPDKI